MSELNELSYPDYCIVTRNTHRTDEWDKPVKTELYSGPCDFQSGRQVSQSIVTSTEVVYIPKGVKIRPGDTIRVEPEFDEAREGVVEQSDILKLDLTGDMITEVQINQSKLV